MHRLFLFLVLSLLTKIAVADVISPEQALARASKFPAKGVSKEYYSGARLLDVKRVGNLPTVYIFQGQNKGLILLSADDAAEAVLGYTETPDINPTLNWWIEEYGREITWIRNNAASHRLSDMREVTEHEPIAPLLTTKWDQGSPYNLMCPQVGFENCVTGCTATAMAQVVNYHRIPATKGTGKISYVWNKQTLEFDFDSTPFDWDNMLDIYDYNATEVQEDAVATLMYACGVATRMDYGLWGSGANCETAIPALIENFGFDKSLHSVERRFYGLHEWNELIYQQLREVGPVQYNGYNSQVGHSFVCDGYSADGFFHINWGWGGMSDGYFRLTALDPDSQGIGGSTAGYDYGQSIMVNFGAPVEGSEYYEQIYVGTHLEVSATELVPGSDFTIDGGFYYSGTLSASGEIGCNIENVADNTSTFYKSFDFRLEPGYGYGYYNIRIPENIEDGNYRIYPAWKSRKGEVHNMPVDISYAQYVTMEVKDGRVKLSVDNEQNLEVTKFEAVTPFFTEHSFTVKGEVINRGDREYYGIIFAALFKRNDYTYVASGEIYTVDLQPGQSDVFEYRSVFSSVTDRMLSAGDYVLAFADMEGNIISDVLDISVQESPVGQGKLSVSDFRFDGDSNHADAGDLNFKLDATCTKGYFIGELSTYVFPEYGGAAITGFRSQTVYLP
ncbi:MAG: C10 family peptidase, partial [Muribaculaceae bacterium]|nr:C10 family peptidase [Muribaculaceae bacterium]